MKQLNILLWVVAVLVLGGIIVYLYSGLDKDPPLGGVTVGNEYTATTTPSGTGAWTDQQLQSGWGALGSVIITKAGDTEFVLYDATSTAVLTTGFGTVGQSTSTQQLARITENLVAGTYVFDVMYTNGLLMDVIRGTTGTSTITHR